MAEKLQFDLVVGVNNLGKAIDDATSSSKKLGDTISVAVGNIAAQGAIKAFDLLSKAIGNTTDFVFDSIKAAQVQEEALNKLSQALKSTGEFSDSAVDSFAAFASELQKTSKFGDEVILGQLAIAKSFGATNQEAKDLIQAAANLSATFGTSLESNVRNLGKTFSGLTGELGESIPQLRNLTQEQLKAGEAIRITNELFSGAAASEISTFQGALTQLSNSYGDLKEEIGFFIIGLDSSNSLFSVAKSLVEELTTIIKDYRTEQARQNGTLVETESTLTRLTEQYAKVKEELEGYQQVVENDKSKSLIQSLFSFDNAPLAREKVQLLTAELQKLEAQIERAAAQVGATPEADERERTVQASQQELQRIRQLEAEKQFIIQQAELENQTFREQLTNESIQNEFAKQEAEIQRISEFEAQKAELAFQFAEERANAIESQALREAELAKIGKQRELEFTKLGNKQILSEEQLRLKRNQDSIFAFKKFEEQTNKERIQNLQSTFGTIATLSNSGNRTLAAIGKAAAISTATIDGIAAVQKALASAPPPVNFALAAAVGTATAANVAKIAGVNFEQGGIVGATRGQDNQLAAIRTGEMVLNADDQKTLFDAIKSGNLGGGQIVVQIDGRTVATALRDQFRGGFRFA